MLATTRRHSDADLGGSLGTGDQPHPVRHGPSLVRQDAAVKMEDVSHLAESFSGVRRTTSGGFAQWRYHGRLIARQMDDAHVVIRADFDVRDSLLRDFPGTFSVPPRFVKHMMVVADIAGGEAGAIEDALEAAWDLQQRSD